jgi:hypothetical protein
MARLLRGVPVEFELIGTEFEEQCEAYEKLQARALGIWKFPMADSYAFYEIVSVQPLQLRWIPYMDKWKAPKYAIRGLRSEDIYDEPHI